MRRQSAQVLALGLIAAAVTGAGAASSAVGAVLPDLVSEPIGRYAFDTTTLPTRTLLRIDGGLTNRGPGDLIIVGSRGSTSEPLMTGFQRIANGDGLYSVGGFTDSPTVFGLELDEEPPHGHWHAQRLTKFRLQRLGGPVAREAEIPFCVRDNKNEKGIVAPATPRRYLDCGNALSTSVLMGLQVGFTDLYEAEIPDQWIDITGLAPGRYTLTAAVDPAGLVTETDEGNNATDAPLKFPAITDTLPRQRSTAKEVRVRPRGRNAIVAYGTLSHTSMVRADIFLLRGKRVTLVRSLAPRRYKAGGIRFPWNGRVAGRRLARPGLYSIKLTAVASRIKSDPKYFKFRILPPKKR